MSDLTVKLAAVVGSGTVAVGCTKAHLFIQMAQPAPHRHSLVTGFGHFWEELAFSEKLNVSYSIVRLVHVKCCGAIGEHC